MKTKAKKIMPFGSQYLKKIKPNSPGDVHNWNWKPVVNLSNLPTNASWPGTTGTGPTAKEDERYGENG